MAPQRSADGLLETLRTATSARLCLALVAAALFALPGCGGDDSGEPQSASAPTTSVPAKATPQGGGDNSSSQDPKDAQLAKERAAAEAAIEGKSPSGNGAGKQGPSIKPPKGPQEKAPSAQERAEATLASMSLSSPVLQPGPEAISALPSTYTCAGKNTPPPLSWQGVPAGTEELVLFVLNLEPINEALFFDWAVAGIDPSLEGLPSTPQLPKGAIPGRNSFGKLGYSICPKGGPETIIFALYALPGPSGAKRGFDPMSLRKEVLERSGNSGLMAVSYGG